MRTGGQVVQLASDNQHRVQLCPRLLVSSSSSGGFGVVQSPPGDARNATPRTPKAGTAGGTVQSYGAGRRRSSSSATNTTPAVQLGDWVAITTVAHGTWIGRAWPLVEGSGCCSCRCDARGWSSAEQPPVPIIVDPAIALPPPMGRASLPVATQPTLHSVTLLSVVEADRAWITWERWGSEEDVGDPFAPSGRPRPAPCHTSSTAMPRDAHWLEVHDRLDGLVVQPGASLHLPPYVVHVARVLPMRGESTTRPASSPTIQGYRITLATRLAGADGQAGHVPASPTDALQDGMARISLQDRGAAGVPAQAHAADPVDVREVEDTLVLPSMQATFDRCAELLALPFQHAELMRASGIQCPKGVLLSGPPGIGKTHLIRQLVQHFGCRLLCITQASTEAEIQEMFRAANATQATPAREGEGRPTLIFMDELDAIAPSREGGSASAATSRILATLLTCMDGLGAGEGSGVVGSARRAIVLAATNRPHAIDAALRRPGRLDREIVLSPPSSSERAQILAHFLRHLPHEGVDVEELAESTPGYVTADLIGLLRAAMLLSRKDEGSGPGEGPTPHLTAQAVRQALRDQPPSLTRSFQLPLDRSMTWDDVAGYSQLKHQLRRYLEWPSRHPATYRRLGLRPVQGILLHGPPGTSKTSLAKVIAAQSKASFFRLSGAEMYSCYLGESEAILRATFQRAREAAPSILFLDELDTLVSSRFAAGGGGGASGSGGGSDPIATRLLATLLNEMDGIESSASVLVLGATNRLDCMDPALVRPGRFVPLAVPLPGPGDRADILRHYLRSVPHKLGEADVQALVDRTHGCSGADLQGLVQEACLAAMAEGIPSSLVSVAHFPSPRFLW